MIRPRDEDRAPIMAEHTGLELYQRHTFRHFTDKNETNETQSAYMCRVSLFYIVTRVNGTKSDTIKKTQDHLVRYRITVVQCF